MRFRPRQLVLIVLTLSAWSQVARPGQPDNFTPRKLLAIDVTGGQKFKPSDVVAATGLTIGMTAGEDEFRRAAQRLGDSGAFTDVTYSYSYSDAGAKLTLEVKDADDFVPARFDDFVGFSDDELRARIKDRLPLFDGTLPASGKLAAHVSDVLQGMLIEKHIPGHVTYDRMVEETGGKVQAILYSVEGVSILIRKALVSGAAAPELPRLQAEVDRLRGTDYKRSALQSAGEKLLLPILHERGYVNASVAISPPQLVTAPDDSSDDKARTSFVDVEFVVSPELQYRLAGVEWLGNKTIPTDKLNSQLRGRTGELANTVELAADLNRVRDTYGSIGYIRAVIKAVSRVDDAAGTVIYSLDVTENERFNMGELEIRGVDRTQEARIREAWKLRRGEVYDAGYLKTFLVEAVKLLPTTVDWTTTHHVTANVREQTVDVELDFIAQATK
jgi:outer membrane protein assembly factor BamA